MGILGNEAADVLAKQAVEGVPLDDHKKWMSGGGLSGSRQGSGRGNTWRRARMQFLAGRWDGGGRREKITAG